MTSQFGNYVLGHILDSEYDRHADDKLSVFQKIVDNFGLQSLGHFDNPQVPRRPEHECFYVPHQHAHHVVKKCLLARANVCRGWSEMRNQLVNLVLDGSGSPKHQFKCFRDRDFHMVQMLDALRFGQMSRSRAASERSGRPSAGTGRHQPRRS